MSRGMADIIGEHRDIAWDHTTGKAHCGGCDAVIGRKDAGIEAQERKLAAHVAEVLTQAGYGLLIDHYAADPVGRALVQKIHDRKAGR